MRDQVHDGELMSPDSPEVHNGKLTALATALRGATATLVNDMPVIAAWLEELELFQRPVPATDEA